MHIVSVVGARPQFIKAAPVSEAIRSAGNSEFLAHTGQHYDHGMSQVFFEELGLPTPDVNLEIGSGSHAYQTGNILIRLEQVLLEQQPDWVLVYGDTNSTLAGSLAAAKLGIPLAHVEAGLRSFNRAMPEEHNRVLTDHCSDLLLCPTQTAVGLLANEGLVDGVHLVGDTMYDAVLRFADLAQQRSSISKGLNLRRREYLLATIHRPYNTDVKGNLQQILSALVELDEPVIFPIHPRTRQKISEFQLQSLIEGSGVRAIQPVGYLDMLMLERHARLILTDSGGMQKEAFFFGVPCITLRPETEWVETVNTGWNILTGANHDAILEGAKFHQWPTTPPPNLYGDGYASHKIVKLLSAR